MFPSSFFPEAFFTPRFFPRPATAAGWTLFDAFQSALVDAAAGFAAIDPGRTLALAADAAPDDFAAVDPNLTLALTAAEVAR
ncbi:hypothetical protein [Aquisphaera insulae]|uniref:hypothetical protein n=1 Tax=Aquisphaera insulae TaxID=2712864 RepID=UPI0013EAA54C|nr:hypothetical protein [Aquisphaera insulae]